MSHHRLLPKYPGFAASARLISVLLVFILAVAAFASGVATTERLGLAEVPFLILKG